MFNWRPHYDRRLKSDPIAGDLVGCAGCPPETEVTEIGEFPSIVCAIRVRDVWGNLVTLQRTYLTQNGKKAKVGNAKKMMPIPECVHNVLIWADKDKSVTGEKSANVLKAKLEKRGIRVYLLLPNLPSLERKGLTGTMS